MARGRRIGIPLAGLALAVLTACDFDAAPPVATPPAAAPPPPPVERPVVEPGPESRELALYYQRLQNDLLAQGLLRGDGGGPDTAFTDTMLARNFVRIALFDEYVSDGDFLRPQATLSKLRRWERPVRMAVEFGESVPLAQRTRDSATVAAYAARLSRISGLPIATGSADPNFHVLMLNEDDRKAAAARIREIVPGISLGTLNAMVNLQRTDLCIVVAFAEGNAPSYSKAIAIIRAEHPELLRTACIHEELAQGLGLANDSPQARPSIFNDDEEFGLLTTHDELLLRMLYDPRLRAGMAPAEAAPIARQIARELMASGPS